MTENYMPLFEQILDRLARVEERLDTVTDMVAELRQSVWQKLGELDSRTAQIAAVTQAVKALELATAEGQGRDKATAHARDTWRTVAALTSALAALGMVLLSYLAFQGGR